MRKSYQALLKEARYVYENTKRVPCPYFKELVLLTSDGFNHLLNKQNRQPRTILEQRLKLRLLKKAVHVISVAGTLQEYRSNLETVRSKKNRYVQYWAFHDIVGETNRFLIRTIVRKVGDGPYHFWSVMPMGKVGKRKLHREGIESS